MKWEAFIVVTVLLVAVSGKHVQKKTTKSKPHLRQEVPSTVLINELSSPTVTPMTQTENIVTASQESSTSLDTQPRPIPNCGYEINGLNTRSGSITSPGYPSDYPDNQYCVWTIKAGPGKRVRLNFTDFDVSGSEGCDGDRLSVAGSDGGLQNQRYCGTNLPVPLETQGENVILEFWSNSEDRCKGFKADFEVDDIEFSCGAEVSVSQFAFQSPNYPAPMPNSTEKCEVKISHECELPICQIRLDFLDFELQPPERGDCSRDAFMMRANEPAPILCGINTGQHMYINVKDRSSTSIHILTNPIYPKPVGHQMERGLQYDIAEGWQFEYNGTRRWNIRVTQIPCDCSLNELPDIPKAPAGCLQYYKDIKQTFRSFNYGGTKVSLESCWDKTDPECGKVVKTGHLNNLDYSVCIESHPSYCSIIYTATSNNSFSMSGVPGAGVMYGISSCQSDFLHIPGGLTPGVPNGKSHDRFCGMEFGNYIQGPVVTSTKPFNVQVITDEDEGTTSEDLENGGFEITYQQIPCSAAETFVGRVWK